MGRTTSFIIALLVLCVPFVVRGQQPTVDTRLKILTMDSGPADLRMSGPSTGSVNQPLTITVSGLPGVDLGKTVGEQTKWIDALRFDVSTPDGRPAELDKELSMGVSPWEWRLRCTLHPATSGVYVVVCDWNEAPFGLALHRVVIGGTDPPPDPPPGPDAEADQVTIVTESQETLPAEQQQIVNGEEVRSAATAAGLEFHAVDKDVSGPSAVLVGHVLAACKGKPVPRLVFSQAGKVIYNEPLPATVQATLALIKKYGGKK